MIAKTAAVLFADEVKRDELPRCPLRVTADEWRHLCSVDESTAVQTYWFEVRCWNGQCGCVRSTAELRRSEGFSGGYCAFAEVRLRHRKRVWQFHNNKNDRAVLADNLADFLTREGHLRIVFALERPR